MSCTFFDFSSVSVVESTVPPKPSKCHANRDRIADVRLGENGGVPRLNEDGNLLYEVLWNAGASVVETLIARRSSMALPTMLFGPDSYPCLRSLRTAPRAVPLLRRVRRFPRSSPRGDWSADRLCSLCSLERCTPGPSTSRSQANASDAGARR